MTSVSHSHSTTRINAAAVLTERDRQHASPSTAASHDPLICGMDRESSCPDCRPAFDRPAPPQSLWHKLVARFPLVGRLTGAWLVDCPPQPQPDDRLLVAVLALLADEDRRAPIVAALAGDIAAIARRASMERAVRR